MLMKKNPNEYSECILAKKTFPVVINANNSGIIGRFLIGRP